MKVNSLKGNASYDSIFKSKEHQLSSGPFKIFLKKNESEKIFLGLIVPKKKILLATNRNFIKRRARELAKDKSLEGFNIIFLVTNKIKIFDKSEIKNHIKKLKRKLESLLSHEKSVQ